VARCRGVPGRRASCSGGAAGRAAIAAALGRETPASRARVSPRRLAAVLAPVAVVAALVVGVANLAGPRDGDDVDGGAGAGSAGVEDSAGGEEQAGAVGVYARAGRVAGPPARVVRVLRAEGLDARAEAGAVYVVTDSVRARRRLDRALRTLGPGPVEVLAAEP
jgi:hypothetical protein